MSMNRRFSLIMDGDALFRSCQKEVNEKRIRTLLIYDQTKNEDMNHVNFCLIGVNA